MLARASRLVDRWIDRGEGLDAAGDPFGPPLDPAEVELGLAAVRAARFGAGPPFRAPLPVDGTPSRIDAVLRRPAEGVAWCVIATPYGAFSRPAELGLYETHARAGARHGLGVAALEPPFHGARTMRGQTSGWGFVRADLGHTTRAVLAYAAEVAALARHLREARGAAHVVGLGVSLGGTALGLAAAHGAPFDRLAFLAAPDNPAAFYATGSNRARRRATLAAAGYDLARVAEAFRPVAPSTYAAPAAPTLFAVPREDQVVPPSTQEAWRAAWRGELLDLGPLGHGLALASRKAAASLAAWLAR